MSIEIKLIGFGEDRPARFSGSNQLQLELDTPTSVRALLHSIGIKEAPDLILMNTETVIHRADWDESRIGDDSSVTIMSAIEGG